MKTYFFIRPVHIYKIKEQTNINIINYLNDGKYDAYLNNIHIIFKVSPNNSIKVDRLLVNCNDEDKKLILNEIIKISSLLFDESLHQLYKDLTGMVIGFNHEFFSLESLINPKSSYFDKLKMKLESEKGLRNKKYTYSNDELKSYSFKDVQGSQLSLSEMDSFSPHLSLDFIKSGLNIEPKMIINKQIAIELIELLHHFIENGELPNANIETNFNKWLLD